MIGSSHKGKIIILPLCEEPITRNIKIYIFEKRPSLMTVSKPFLREKKFKMLFSFWSGIMVYVWVDWKNINSLGSMLILVYVELLGAEKCNIFFLINVNISFFLKKEAGRILPKIFVMLILLAAVRSVGKIYRHYH